MSEEKVINSRKLNNRNIDIGLVGMFLSIFFITGGVYCWVYTFGFIIPAGVLVSLSTMVWGVFSLIWIGYWWNIK